MTDPNPTDPAELFVVLHNSGRVASAWSERESADDNATGWNAHVSCYVPKAELERVKAERDKLAERIRGLEAGCEHRFDIEGECIRCEMKDPRR